jgi:hypothetical protein
VTDEFAVAGELDAQFQDHGQAQRMERLARVIENIIMTEQCLEHLALVLPVSQKYLMYLEGDWKNLQEPLAYGIFEGNTEVIYNNKIIKIMAN